MYACLILTQQNPSLPPEENYHESCLNSLFKPGAKLKKISYIYMQEGEHGNLIFTLIKFDISTSNEGSPFKRANNAFHRMNCYTADWC